ncbi:MAG: PLP-dependent transferase, partial [Crocinitomicaceae bacterium]|nr:PLP-dependent transferase [Crocinitomicaceae bacterium]
MKKTTRSIHQRSDTSKALPAMTPLFQNSAFEFESDYFYTRKNNPNTEEFEDAVKILEECEFGISTNTGMSAINLVLTLLKPGQTVVLNREVYGCTYKLFQWFTENYQLKLVVADLTNPANMAIHADMVFFETPTNPFLLTVEIKKTCESFKKINPACLVVVDNTWATPLFQSPCLLGADISLHSATKYLSGHSDVMGGIILTNNASIHSKLLTMRFLTGTNMDPHSAWLLRRSLYTLEARLNQQSKTTSTLIEYLKTKKEIKKIYYPKLDKEQLSNYATLIFVDISDDLLSRYKDFCDQLTLFST